MNQGLYLNQELQKLLKNEKQRQAYFHDEHCTVQAGPGSGKTATLALKILWLLQEKITPPSGLACLTYNNEAVREFRSRLKLLGLIPRLNVFLGTVHSFCMASIIRPFGKLYLPEYAFPLVVAPNYMQKSYLKKALDKHGIRESPSRFKSRFDVMRRVITDRTCKQWHKDEDCAIVIEYYEKMLHADGYLDFDDIILLSLRLIESQPFVRKCIAASYPWFVIDEYQDLGYPLHRIVMTLLDHDNIKVFAVGDPDQSIYGFTGASPKYFKELATRNDVTEITLDLNYRCGQKIIDGAEIILSDTAPRNYKASRGEVDPGEVYFIERSGGLQEQTSTIVKEILPQVTSEGYQPRNTAILYIDRNDASVIISGLNDGGIKYTGERDQRYQRAPLTRWIEGISQWCCGIRGRNGVRFKDLSEYWMHLLRETGEIASNVRILNLSSHFFDVLSNLQQPEMSVKQWLTELNSKLSLSEKITMLKKSPEEQEAFNSMLTACDENKPLCDFNVADLAGCGPSANNLYLTTLHSSKGMQFDVVIIPGLEEGRLPSSYAESDDAIREARRTFYVGFTRARYLVYLLYSGWYQYYSSKVEDGPSRFILELQERLT